MWIAPFSSSTMPMGVKKKGKESRIIVRQVFLWEPYVESRSCACPQKKKGVLLWGEKEGRRHSRPLPLLPRPNRAPFSFFPRLKFHTRNYIPCLRAPRHAKQSSAALLM